MSHNRKKNEWKVPALGSIVVVVLAWAAIPDGSACAHDFWIEPSNFRPAVGEAVKIALRVGEHFKGDPVVRKSEKIEQFLVTGPDGSKPVVGQDGADPAGVVDLAVPGVYVVGYRSKRSSIELEAAKFEEYLKEEGLEKIAAMRAQRGESGKAGREVYSRSCKSLLMAGGEGAGFDRRLGMTLELVPQRNPYTWRESDAELPVVLLYEGKPLEGVEVAAMNQADADGSRHVRRTDREGRATFRLARPGVWLIKAVYMKEVAVGVDADWESIWATLTFEVR